MLQSLLNSLFGCSHQRTTFPQTPGRKTAGRTGTYVVCLDCGKEFAYNWDEMRVAALKKQKLRIKDELERLRAAVN